MTIIKIAIESDLHYTIEGRRPDKALSITKIHQYQPDVLIVAGDITDRGFDGKPLLSCLPFTNQCWGGTQDQLGTYQRDYLARVDGNIEVLECEGNHDTYVPRPYLWHPVRQHIINKHGALRYHRNIKGLHFVVLGIYPDKKALAMKEELMLIIQDQPVVFIWHYNSVPGDPMTEERWWTTKEKQAAAEFLNNFNVAFLVNGHWHTTEIRRWGKWDIYMGAGSEPIFVEYDTELKTVIPIVG